MAKITFVYPDFESLGVEYLMAVALRNGHEVDFVYYDAEDIYIGKRPKQIPFQEIAKKIIDTKPHIAAFSCVTDNYQFQLSCARAVKEINPGIITMFGGVHPSAVPERVLQKDEVDCVAIGEAEISFANFIGKGNGNSSFALPDRSIKGIVFKREGNLIGEFTPGEVPNLDSLPFPHKEPVYSKLKSALYEYRTMTSRGCPYKCSYCFNSYFHGLRGENTLRQRKIDNVIDELARAKNHYRPRYVYFMDDSFATNIGWLSEFCRRYKKEIDLPFACIANPNYITKEKAEILSVAGCINIQIGVQSLSDDICREILYRKANNAHLIDVIKWLKDAGIWLQIDHMLGIPGDTVDLQEKSLKFYSKHKPDLVSVFWLTYYPKTAIIDIVKQRNILSEEDINNIEEGKLLTKRSFVFGGDMKDPGPYYSIAFMFNYLTILPSFFVNFLLRTKLYRLLKIKNLFISVSLPRVIGSIFKRGDFRGRSHIVRFFHKNFFNKSHF